MTVTVTSVDGDTGIRRPVDDSRGERRRPGSAGCARGDRADLLVTDAELVATVDDARREIPGGWVAVTGGVVSALGGPADPPPPTRRTSTRRGCLVTPGLVNTHHHLYQNLTRAYAPALTGGLFDWLVTLYPLWARLDEEAAYVSAVRRADRAGARRLHDLDRPPLRAPARRRRPDLRRDRRGPRPGHAVPPDPRLDVAVGRRTAGCRRTRWCRTTTRSWPTPSGWSSRTTTGRRRRMTRIALAPCSPFSVSTALMTRAPPSWPSGSTSGCTPTSCETQDEDDFCLATFGRRPVDYLADVGWVTDRSWVAHVRLARRPARSARLGAAGVGAAHCPTQQHDPGQRAGAGRRAAGGRARRSGWACDGSASADSASLWLEARTAMLQGKLRHGAARDVGAGRAGDRHPRRGGLPRPRPARSASCPSAPAATWSSGR